MNLIPLPIRIGIKAIKLVILILGILLLVFAIGSIGGLDLPLVSPLVDFLTQTIDAILNLGGVSSDIL
ncbi:hypothetical protein SAMN04488691_105120 [Haloferax larsenii]|uniref:Uncharacterized protein n=1 Tax=Haloferax larsenii TaxID=302484 RepID=A0A1H7QQP0_HALLR|nr:hypothetical protein SAMN04488691_105120 [Haloferax larsenii]